MDAIPLTDTHRIAVFADRQGRTYPVPLLVTSAGVRRARPGDGAAVELVALLADGDRDIGNLRVTSWHHSPATGERAITVDQTNESVVVGELAVVKWTFLADEGPHPAPSLLAELSRHGFTGMPRPWGAVEWQPADGSPPRLLALVVELLPGAVDGWTWLVDDLREAARSGDDSIARSAGDAVGALAAAFHLALAGTSRPSTVPEAAALRASAVSELERALSVTSGAAHDVLARYRGRVRAALEAMPVDAAPVMRVHGDLHVGQVLRTGSAYALTDFDGNPVLPASSRTAEQPSALDVAGMAQSFTHAGLVVRKHHSDLPPERVDHAARTARSAFLSTYRETAGDEGTMLDERMLLPLALRQVCLEFTYAATHLPRWSYVPQAALPLLLED